MTAQRGPKAAAVGVVRASLRLPELALEALGELRPMREDLGHMRAQTGTMPDLLPAIERLEDAIAPLDQRLDALERTITTLAHDVTAMHHTLDAMKAAIENIPGVSNDERGLLAKARDTLTGDTPPRQ